jgi:hypothetical protein
MDLSLYYAEEEPSIYFLKETLGRKPRGELLQLIERKAVVLGLDSFFLKDAIEFLRLSILNLLAYKFLMSGSFLAWGKVTLYYSNFYSVNCLIRLKGFALVHIDYIDEKPLVVRVERMDEKHGYSISNWKGGNTHLYLWNKFHEFYPKLSYPLLGKLMIKNRVEWNYDLDFPSQSMADYAKEDAKIRWENNFLDPNFGNYSDPGAAQYYYDLMADTGYEEAGSGDFIKECVNLLTKIASESKHKSWYASYFAELKKGIEDFGSHPNTKKEIQSWLDKSVADLEKS